jgi:transposase InsO family protein
MTDHGVSFRSRRYAKALRLLKIKHLRTRPYTPKTNGKAERFARGVLLAGPGSMAARTSRPTQRRAARICQPGLIARIGRRPLILLPRQSERVH